MADYSIESSLHRLGARLIAGVDEVGRGPLAGPVTAAAVILAPVMVPPGLNDSKKLTVNRRAELARDIHRVALVGIGEATVEEIDEINILQATFLAMHRAIAALPVTPDALLIDGNRAPKDLPCPAHTIPKGDGRSVSIAAASIVAKEWRDRGMRALAQQYPEYGWEKNAGYGTAQHLTALKSHGATTHHRRSFAPVRNILLQEKSIESEHKNTLQGRITPGNLEL
ncbi:ribonuclease HII [Palleronia caenipelagi]|uniref:Ribonuclease HII n=1 Tax=Palleronia caenipelagi TaxID=2489174 RepID=A0A547Q9X7_9RHOB|nr:ribonuclease HII [Palleronia caenipelagi]TRD23195.1 ribonuclease HII [Palleronia caenipelagi]